MSGSKNFNVNERATELIQAARKGTLQNIEYDAYSIVDYCAEDDRTLLEERYGLLADAIFRSLLTAPAGEDFSSLIEKLSSLRELAIGRYQGRHNPGWMVYLKYENKHAWWNIFRGPLAVKCFGKEGNNLLPERKEEADESFKIHVSMDIKDEEQLKLVRNFCMSEGIFCFKFIKNVSFQSGNFLGKQLVIYPQLTDMHEGTSDFWSGFLERLKNFLDKAGIDAGEPPQADLVVGKFLASSGKPLFFVRNAFNIFGKYVEADKLSKFGFTASEAADLSLDRKFFDTPSVQLPSCLTPSITEQNALVEKLRQASDYKHYFDTTILQSNLILGDAFHILTQGATHEFYTSSYNQSQQIYGLVQAIFAKARDALSRASFTELSELATFPAAIIYHHYLKPLKKQLDAEVTEDRKKAIYQKPFWEIIDIPFDEFLMQCTMYSCRDVAKCIRSQTPLYLGKLTGEQIIAAIQPALAPLHASTVKGDEEKSAGKEQARLAREEQERKFQEKQARLLAEKEVARKAAEEAEREEKQREEALREQREREEQQRKLEEEQARQLAEEKAQEERQLAEQRAQQERDRIEREQNLQEEQRKKSEEKAKTEKERTVVVSPTLPTPPSHSRSPPYSSHLSGQTLYTLSPHSQRSPTSLRVSFNASPSFLSQPKSSRALRSSTLRSVPMMVRTIPLMPARWMRPTAISTGYFPRFTATPKPEAPKVSTRRTAFTLPKKIFSFAHPQRRTATSQRLFTRTMRQPFNFNSPIKTLRSQRLNRRALSSRFSTWNKKPFTAWNNKQPALSHPRNQRAGKRSFTQFTSPFFSSSGTQNFSKRTAPRVGGFRRFMHTHTSPGAGSFVRG